MNTAADKEIIILSRDIIAMLVPSGARITLREGTEVILTQALGNAFTVNVYGNLVRIDSQDADALGKTVTNPLDELPVDADISQKIDAQLRTVYDPEIPVNIVDLGLIYRVDAKLQADNTYHVEIDMTLTAPGCGMGPVIAADAEAKVNAIQEVSKVDIQLVFDPPWNQDMMSEAAKLQLGLF